MDGFLNLNTKKYINYIIIISICNARTSVKTLMAQWAKKFTKQTLNQNLKKKHIMKNTGKIIDYRQDPWDGFSEQSWKMWENYKHGCSEVMNSKAWVQP